MSAGEGFAAPKRRRFADMDDARIVDPDEKQKAYYSMLAQRLEGLLQEIETTGTSPEDDLVKRLRALYSEVSRQVGPQKAEE